MGVRFLLPFAFIGGLLPPLLPTPPPERAIPTLRPDVVWIEGGWFTRGADEADLVYVERLCLRDPASRRWQRRVCLPEFYLDETPRRRIWVSSFGIDRTEVSHRAYRRCVADNRCPPPRISDSDERLGRPEHPVAGITWAEAVRYCEWAGGRLPTEAEWERAARGADARRFPWGNHYNDRLANHGRLFFDDMTPDPVDGYRHAAPVDAFPGGRSPYGLSNMAGNVYEWTADAWVSESYASGTRVDPTGPITSTGERVIRGGSWRWPAFALRTTHRTRLGQEDARPDVGVRCAYDPRGR